MSFLGDESIVAAEAALCANMQGQFWTMHESIYANQFGENQGAFSRDRLDQMAEQIGLDMTAFGSCMDNGEQRGAVTNYANVAQQDGVSSTRPSSSTTASRWDGATGTRCARKSSVLSADNPTSRSETLDWIAIGAGILAILVAGYLTIAFTTRTDCWSVRWWEGTRDRPAEPVC